MDILGFPSLGQSREALHVGEEHRDQLSLSLEACSRAEDPLGQMLRRVLPGSCESEAPSTAPEGSTTAVAEAIANRIVELTRWTRQLQAVATGPAEPSFSRVLRLAFRAAHDLVAM